MMTSWGFIERRGKAVNSIDRIYVLEGRAELWRWEGVFFVYTMVIVEINFLEVRKIGRSVWKMNKY